MVGDNKDSNATFLKLREIFGTQVTQYNLGNNIKALGASAFEDCTELTTIELPEDVTVIPASLFAGCTSLSSIVIPAKVKDICSSAFEGCTSLTSIDIPSGVTALPPSLFEGCTSLSSVVLSTRVTSIGASAFKKCYSLSSINLPKRVTDIGSAAFQDCRSLSTVVVPDDVSEINDFLFAGCSNLSSVSIPEGVKHIGVSAFMGCGKIKSFVIPKDVTAINSQTFANCTQLSSISIPTTVRSIGASAFAGCTSLTTFDVTGNYTEIGSSAFSGCSRLSKITIVENISPLAIPSDVFQGISSTAVLWVPAGFKGAYNAANGWKTIPNIREKVMSIYAMGYGSVKCKNDIIRSSREYVDIQENETAILTLSPYEGYVVAGVVSGDGTDLTNRVTNGQVSIENVHAGTTITVRFIREGLKNFKVDGNHYEITELSSGHVYIISIGGSDNIVIPDPVVYDGCEWSVRSVSPDLFKGKSAISSVVWNAPVKLTSELTVELKNPNLLCYVVDEAYAPDHIGNVIIDGQAKDIKLKDTEDFGFHCPLSFTTKEVSYTHEYNQQTTSGICNGWDTLVLPFDVTEVWHETQGRIYPFGSLTDDDVADGFKPFWLYEYTEDGRFVEASSIHANVPYIISMPNEENLWDTYRLNGRVTFKGSDVKVKSTDDIPNVQGIERTFMPNYRSIPSSDALYLLNVEDAFEGHAEGSVFARGRRAAHPFESYFRANKDNGVKSCFPVFDMQTDIIREIKVPVMKSKAARDKAVYDLCGRRMADIAQRKIKKGIYIVNGKKISIR